MTETRLPELVDAIIAAIQAKDPSLTVWDGPIISGDYSNAVYIGYDGDPSEGEERASGTQQGWAGIGTKKRNEENEVTCAVVTLTGDDDSSWKPARDTTFAILRTVGEALRADPSLGIAPPSTAELWPGEYFQEAGPQGFQARIVFTVKHTTRV